MNQGINNTTNSQKPTDVNIHKSIEPLISFIKVVKTEVNKFKEEFRKEFKNYLDNTPEILTGNQLVNNNEYIQKHSFPIHHKIEKLYEKTMKSLSDFIKIIMKDYANVLSMASQLSDLKSKHVQLSKKFKDHEVTLAINQLYQLTRDIENVIEQHNKLVAQFNSSFEKFYALKKNLCNGILAYTSLNDKTITFSNESELAEFQRLIETDESLKKRFTISKSFADKLKTTLVNSADKTVLLSVTPLKNADWAIGSEVPPFSSEFGFKAEPETPSPNPNDQSDRSTETNTPANSSNSPTFELPNLSFQPGPNLYQQSASSLGSSSQRYETQNSNSTTQQNIPMGADEILYSPPKIGIYQDPTAQPDFSLYMTGTSQTGIPASPLNPPTHGSVTPLPSTHIEAVLQPSEATTAQPPNGEFQKPPEPRSRIRTRSSNPPSEDPHRTRSKTRSSNASSENPHITRHKTRSRSRSSHHAQNKDEPRKRGTNK